MRLMRLSGTWREANFSSDQLAYRGTNLQEGVIEFNVRRPQFLKIEVVDKHLVLLAKQHIETRFIKINAEKSPFLAEKLKIVVLPTLALIKNAKVDDYVVGFNELGGTDGFTTEELEERLAKAQVLLLEGESAVNAPKTSASTRSVRQSRNADSSDSD
ncbi:hypothetical protein GIB67_033832 [Kingdonia uniflora]|uniref:Thioredoxin domain-containing protein n=1 Tax=Kingdonia uniflora TaxID=39325 RepID=A0A7J7LID1_9MAGN|nr:hypothetical protein GIB67_033832 [Kingdonia uniflora]